MNKDYIIRGTAAEGQIRAFAATTKNLVEIARQHHNTSPVATAALGRLLTAGAMMGSMQKGEKDLVTLIIRGDGPMQGLVVTAASDASVKGYVYNPGYVNPPNYMGKFDVGGAIGYGNLTVIKDMGLKEPYSGTTELVTGEIAEDLTYYFATSEQVPSSVALGVLMNKDNTVKQAGGFIVQLMPFAEDETIDRLEKNISEIKSVTSLLDEGLTPEQILEKVLIGLNPVFNDTINPEFKCNCSEERILKAIAGTGRKEIQSMIDEGRDIEVNCQFCNTSYKVTVEQLKKLIS